MNLATGAAVRPSMSFRFAPLSSLLRVVSSCRLVSLAPTSVIELDFSGADGKNVK